MAEAGRTDLMIAAGLKVPNEAFAMVIVRLEIDFKHEMNWPGDVLIQTAVARIGGKSIHMRQTIASGGVETAQAVSILAAIDRHTRRAIALDRTWHERFAPWTLPG
jgi:acyl-CoA thioester hydrolase